jgi:hypothetical protein
MPLALMAQDAPKAKPTFESALLDSRQSLVLSEGKLSGEGAETLDAAQKQARFVMADDPD